MNEYNETDYEAVARSLDGEDVALTDAQMLLASEIRSDESAIAGMLDVTAPPSATRRALNRATAATASHMWNHVRKAFYSGVCVAASIVLVLGIARLTLPAEMSPMDQVAQYYWNAWTTQDVAQVNYMTLDDLDSLASNGNGDSEDSEDSENYEAWSQWLEGGTDSASDTIDLDMLLGDLQES